MVVIKIDKCVECGKEFNNMVEFIDKGIKQAIFCNKKDYIKKEVTVYTKEGVWLCKKCYKEKYEL